jgi:hypothetical protein
MSIGRIACILLLLLVCVLAIQAATQTGDAAPAKFCVRFETSKGNMLLELHRDWAPHGVDRFYELVKSGYYDGVKFHRIRAGTWAQFGINGEPKTSKAWREKTIPDDPAGQVEERAELSAVHAASVICERGSRRVTQSSSPHHMLTGGGGPPCIASLPRSVSCWPRAHRAP